EYGTTYIEKFTSPDNWLPGDETEKTLEVTNSGNVDEAVRVKVEESWKSKNGTTLLLKQGDNVAALINFINGDDWTKVEVDNEDYYYYYYNYKLAPGETTSKLLDKVTFNSAITSSATCSDTIVDGTTTRTCNSNETGYDGATYTLTLTVETIQYNKYQGAWDTSVNIAMSKPEPELTSTGVEYLASNATNPGTITSYNDENADKSKMFVFNHIINDEIITESRYIGDEPNNYVYFNCDEPQEGVEYNYASSCEVWRILGTFDVEREIDDEENPGQKKTITETRMKLVRGYVLPKESYWNVQYNDWTTGEGKNSLRLFLNESYYNSTGDAESYGLTQSARNMIENTNFSLGAISYNSSNYIYFGSAEKLYGEENGSNPCGSCNNDITKLKWQGKVALMYPSDEYLIYAKGVSDTCYNNVNSCYNNYASLGWIYNSNKKINSSSNQSVWCLSPTSVPNVTGGVTYVDERGMLGSNNVSGYWMSAGYYSVRPVVYLSADVKIISGDGSEGSPYKLR
ncbi:MAG: hypothetical protein IJR82_02640, partial [Bacilli bacterium]|nr:hypothetical protein [Bacilli bacterium]